MITYPKTTLDSTDFDLSSSVVKCKISSTKIPEEELGKMEEPYFISYAQLVLCEAHLSVTHKVLLQGTLSLVEDELGL